MQLIRFYKKYLILWVISFSNLAGAQTLTDQPGQVIPKRIFLMGEIHDNPHGHKLRLEMVMQFIEQGYRPLVAMEQFDRENQDDLDVALSTCHDVDCVLAKAATPGWEWSFYKPFVQLALDKKITLIAVNLSNVDVRNVISNGFSVVFNPQAMDTYKLNQIPPALQSAQYKAIQEGHCNMLPSQAIGPMVRGQIARDVWMADVVNSSQNQMVILIAGNGHIRRDAGVFHWLSIEKKKLTQVHGFVESADSSYVNWFDQVHVVPTLEREDPCLVFSSKPQK